MVAAIDTPQRETCGSVELGHRFGLPHPPGSLPGGTEGCVEAGEAGLLPAASQELQRGVPVVANGGTQADDLSDVSQRGTHGTLGSVSKAKGNFEDTVDGSGNMSC